MTYKPFKPFSMGCTMSEEGARVDLRGASILVVDDVPANLEVLCESLEEEGYEVLVAADGEGALKVASYSIPELILLDVVMPGMDGYETCRQLKQHQHTRGIPVVFLTARDEVEGIVEGFSAGGLDYIVKPFSREEVLIRIRTQLERVRLERELERKNQQLQAKNHALGAEIARRRQLRTERDHLADRLSLQSEQEAEHWGLKGFVGHSRTMQRILEDLNLLQQAETTSVLITGESGTGKELIARACHASSRRASEPFIAVNCASIPAALAESLLFGHVQGAFSGADRAQAGYFDLADGGTLFLDEVGEMPVDLQAKLLRVLEGGAVMPLGARESHRVDVRILAATNADLQKQIAAGAFRSDLYYRLARFVVQVPPLRQRQDDIELLALHFLELYAAEMGIDVPVFGDGVVATLAAYAYPGNVRELKNIIERALLGSRGADIQVHHLHLGTTSADTVPTAGPDTATWVEELPFDFAEAETALVQRALRHTGGNVSAAARLLGINRAKVYRKLKQQSPPPAS
jgi:DNA-binding NtrC family response regulator